MGMHRFDGRAKGSGRLHVDLRPIGEPGEATGYQCTGRGGALLVIGTEVGVLVHSLSLSIQVRARSVI